MARMVRGLVPSGIVMSAPFSWIRMATSEAIAFDSVNGLDTVFGAVSAPICTKGTGAIQPYVII